jgi:hypothetical protein
MPFSLLFDLASAIARVRDSDLLLRSQCLLPLQDENYWVTNLLRQYAECRGGAEDRYVSRRLSTHVPLFLINSYLPVAVLPALIALPKHCKRKY